MSYRTHFFACAFGLANLPAVLAANGPEPDRWVLVASESQVQFAITFNVVQEAVGTVHKFGGDLRFDPESGHVEAIAVTLDTGTIDTNNRRRDDHLRADDFFDIARFPQASFQSTAWTPREDGTFELVGDLTLLETTRPVTLDVTWEGIETDRRGRRLSRWIATGTLDRRDWGLSYGGTIGNEVRLRLAITACPAENLEAAPPTPAPDAT